MWMSFTASLSGGYFPRRVGTESEVAARANKGAVVDVRPDAAGLPPANSAAAPNYTQTAAPNGNPLPMNGASPDGYFPENPDPGAYAGFAPAADTRPDADAEAGFDAPPFENERAEYGEPNF